MSEADYPIFLDCIASPAVKRYRKERVIFTTPYTAKLSDLRFLDGDAIHYIAKHTGRELVRPDAVELLPKSKAGGSYVVYRLLAEGPSVEAELPQATEQQIASPASEEPAATAKPQYKGPLQDAAILDALSRLGLEPGSLPPQKRGREGPRAKVWEILKNNRSLFVSRDAFIHAWKRVMRQAKSMP